MLPAAAGHWISGLFCELVLLCGVHVSSFLRSHCLSIWQLRLHVQLLVVDASLFVADGHTVSLTAIPCRIHRISSDLRS